MKKRYETSENETSKQGWKGDEAIHPGNGQGGKENGQPVEKGKEARIPPDPEVEEKPQRRKFTAVYKARIVQEANGCTEKGQIGALLRREGLYSSQLTEWRKLYRQGALTALRDDKRGRKKTHAVERENEKLRQKVAQLERRLQQVETIIEVQKKIAAILGLAQENPETNKDE